MDVHRGGSRSKLPTGITEVEGEGFGDTQSKLLDSVFTRGGGGVRMSIESAARVGLTPT